MGLLVNGVWRDSWYDTSKTGTAVSSRSETSFRDRVSADGSSASRPRSYHLYVSLACPLGASHADLPQAEAART